MSHEDFARTMELAKSWGIIYSSPDGSVHFTEKFKSFFQMTASGEWAERVMKVMAVLRKGGVNPSLAETWATTLLFIQNDRVQFDKNDMLLVVGLVDSLLEVGAKQA